MTTILLRRMEHANLAHITAWFADAETRQRMAGMLPLDAWYAFVTQDPAQRVWLAYQGDQCFGMVQVEYTTSSAVVISAIIAPAWRRRGYGRAVLAALAEQLSAEGVQRMHGTIAPDNSASLRCAAAVGFVPDPSASDADGFVPLVLHLASASD